MGSVNVSIARYGLGVAALAVIVGGLVLAATALRRRFLPAQAGALARLTESVIGVALLTAILETLGAVGQFRLVPILLTTAVVASGIAVVAGRGAVRTDPLRRPRPEVAWPAVLIAGGVAGALAAEWAMPTLGAYDYGIRTFDSLWYHLPWAASFAQTGHITGLHGDLEFLLAFYPATSELFHGLGITLLGRDTLSPALNLVWLALALLAAWCIGRPGRRGAASSAGVAIVLAAPMMYFSQPGSADGDVLGVFLFLAAIALLLNRDPATDRAALIVAALAAGLAVEVKLTFLAPIAALTIGVIATAPHQTRRTNAALWLGPLIAAGGFWYARNLIAIGNPLPWSSFGGLLPVPHAPLQQNTTYAVSHYLTQQRFWSHFFVSGMAAQLGRWWWLIAPAGVLGALICLLPGATRTLRMAALVALAGLAAYLLTPNSAMGPEGDPVGFAFNLRYLAPPLALAFALTPLSPLLNTRNRQIALTAGLITILAATVAEPALWPARHTAAAIALGVLVLAGVAAAAWIRTTGRNTARAAGLIAAAALVTALVIAAYPYQRHYLNARYTFKPSVSHLSGVWAYFRRIHHARVGLVGTYGEFFSYPIAGVDDTNRVIYVAAHGRRGSFIPITTCRGFRAAVNAAHLNYLVTTPERDFWRPTRLRPAPEAGWIHTDRAAKLLLTGRAGGQPINVFAVTGHLDPGTC